MGLIQIFSNYSFSPFFHFLFAPEKVVDDEGFVAVPHSVEVHVVVVVAKQ